MYIQNKIGAFLASVIRARMTDPMVGRTIFTAGVACSTCFGLRLSQCSCVALDCESGLLWQLIADVPRVKRILSLARAGATKGIGSFVLLSQLLPLPI